MEGDRCGGSGRTEVAIDNQGGGAFDQKRLAILKAARHQFMTEGYASAGMAPVAREAGVSTATLYALFPGKAELFRNVILDAAEEFDRTIRRVDDTAVEPRQRLLGVMKSYAAFMSDPFVRSVFRLVAAERRRFADTAAHFFERGKAEFGHRLMQVISEMSARGELEVRKPSWAAGQLMGMVEHPLFLVPMVTGDEVQPNRDIDQIAEEAVLTFLARYGRDPLGPGHEPSVARDRQTA